MAMAREKARAATRRRGRAQQYQGPQCSASLLMPFSLAVYTKMSLEIVYERARRFLACADAVGIVMRGCDDMASCGAVDLQKS